MMADSNIEAVWRFGCHALRMCSGIVALIEALSEAASISAGASHFWLSKHRYNEQQGWHPDAVALRCGLQIHLVLLKLSLGHWGRLSPMCALSREPTPHLHPARLSVLATGCLCSTQRQLI